MDNFGTFPYKLGWNRDGGTTPSNTIAPVISGSTTVGSVLTTTDGTWTGTTPITYTYQWKRGGVAISGATNNTYTTVTADIGENITCEVTATNSFGSASATSNAIVVSGVLISTMKYEWYFNNVLNASGNIITIPDTGTVGGLDIGNPALANKPTASTIGTKISYAADGLDDYMYKATTDFMKSMPTWMVTVVFKYDSSVLNVLFSAYNETNTNPEGVQFLYSPGSGNFTLQARNITGVTTTFLNVAQALVNGTDYIYNFVWDGTNVKLYNQTTQVGTAVAANPFTIPTTTHNLATMGIIRPAAGNFFGRGNIGYIGIDEFDLTRLNNNVTTLKSTFGI